MPFFWCNFWLFVPKLCPKCFYSLYRVRHVTLRNDSISVKD